MVAKLTVKNQLTIPKKILERAGLSNIEDNERYFDIEVKDTTIILKPVRVIVEERIPEKQWQKFENWASKVGNGDVSFDSGEEANEFLKKRTKKR